MIDLFLQQMQLAQNFCTAQMPASSMQSIMIAQDIAIQATQNADSAENMDAWVLRHKWARCCADALILAETRQYEQANGLGQRLIEFL